MDKSPRRRNNKIRLEVAGSHFGKRNLAPDLLQRQREKYCLKKCHKHPKINIDLAYKLLRNLCFKFRRQLEGSVWRRTVE